MNTLVVLALLVQASADTAHEKARQKLEASDAAGAEAEAREALALSLRFLPELELESPPDKGLLFEEMILEARETYRERRAAYFRTLGDALAAQEEWRASRKAYRRAAKMEPDPEIFLLMADDEDLDGAERVALVLDAYLSPGADRIGLEERLLESGLFRSRNALKASLDARRFPELQSKFPDLELLPGAFPSFQIVTDAEMILSQRNHPTEALAFDGANKAFGVGVQIRTPRRQLHRLHADSTECGAERC